MTEPAKVVRTTREVIEHKLLDSLSDEGVVAICASKEDLDALIYALDKIATGKYVAETDWHDFHNADEAARQLRAKEFCAGLKQLRHEAFGDPSR